MTPGRDTGTNSTSAARGRTTSAVGDRDVVRGRVAFPLALRRARFTRHAFSDRPSIPFALAQAPALSPVRRAAARQRRASCSSVIFRCSLIDSSSESTRLSAARRGVTPASLMAHA
ncbi:MAG: hypothetical protein KC543_17030, partial [Myxococcales bacterium]|nr:hypothetical protein [Myxococcales bacterium]